MATGYGILSFSRNKNYNIGYNRAKHAHLTLFSFKPLECTNIYLSTVLNNSFDYECGNLLDCLRDRVKKILHYFDLLFIY